LNESSSSSPPLEKTEVLYGNDNIQRRVLEAYSQIQEQHEACIDHTEVAMVVMYDAIWNGLLNLKKRGIRMRCIVEATSENIVYCKKLTEIAQVRHLTAVRSNFGIADRKLCLLHTIANEEQPLSHAIITNVKGIVEAQQYLFETLWSKAIPLEKKIKEIEEGIVTEFIETLSDNHEIHAILQRLLKSTMRDLLVILPTANTLFRYEEEGVIQSLKEEAKHGAKVRILIQRAASNNDNNNSRLKEEKIIQELIKDPLIEIQYLDKLSNTKLITVVSDRRLSLTIEINDDARKTSNEAIGLATYSNSEATVLTYISIFETLWAVAELKPQT
jgi:two-component system, OmpR family, sensor histidine kinase VicK